MNTQSSAVQVKQPNPLVALHDQMEKRTEQFQAALPAHIPVERFKRVILTAIQNNAKLATADRQTLWNSAMKASQDGLLPDGREGALVIYNTKIKVDGKDVWIEAVQWMPMIAGIRKKVRNSGEIATWDAHVVYEKDAFEYQLGYEPMINHKPYLQGDPGKVIAAYSVATLKSGEKSCEVMTVWQIEKVRAISKSKDRGPWVDHYSEMCRKTVARRHSKVLPMSTDLDDQIRRDDDLYDFAGDRKADKPDRPKLVDFANATMNAPLGEAEEAKAEETKAEPEGRPESETKADPETGEIILALDDPEFGEKDAAWWGTKHFNEKRPSNPPEQIRDKPNLVAAFKAAYDAAEAAAKK